MSYNCKVLWAGPAEDEVVYIRMAPLDGSFPVGWYKANSLVKKEMLAVALLAISTGYPVAAELTNIVEYSVINRLYIMRQ